MIPLDKILALLSRLLWPAMAVWGWTWVALCSIEASGWERRTSAAVAEQGACWAAFDATDIEIRARYLALLRAHAALYARESRALLPTVANADSEDGS